MGELVKCLHRMCTSHIWVPGSSPSSSAFISVSWKVVEVAQVCVAIIPSRKAKWVPEWFLHCPHLAWKGYLESEAANGKASLDFQVKLNKLIWNYTDAFPSFLILMRLYPMILYKFANWYHWRKLEERALCYFMYSLIKKKKSIRTKDIGADCGRAN